MKFIVRLAVALAGIVVLAGCPTETPTPVVTCPYDRPTIQVNGDSNGTHLPQHVGIPGYQVANAAQGQSAFSMEINGVATIGARLLDRVAQCGLPDLLVVQGSTNDLSHWQDGPTIIAAVTDLREQLDELGVPVLWVVQQPVPYRGGWNAEMLAARDEYVAFLRQLDAEVVDCTTVLQDPVRPGWLNPAFEVPVDLLGNPDPLHLNDAGYAAFGACIRAEVERMLTSPDEPA